MATVQTPPEGASGEVSAATETSSDHRTNRGLFAVVMIIVIAMVGLGIWAIVDSDDSGTTLPGAAEETLDGYMEASNDHDGAAMVALVTDDYVFTSYGTVEDVAAHEQTVSVRWESIDFTVDTTGPYAVTSQGGRYLVAQPQVVNWTGTSDIDGMSMLTLVEVDGTWLVDSHEWVVPE